MMAISPKNSPGGSVGQMLLAAAHLARELHAPGLDDVHVLAGVALVEEHVAGGVRLTEALEQIAAHC